MNEGLFTAYQSLPAWKRLMERIGEGGCTALYEIAEGERPFLAAALSHATGRPVLLVAPTELIAQRQAQDIERLTGDGCAMLPARDIQFSRAAMSRDSAWQRLSVLDGLAAGRVKVLCASVDALLDRCAPRARFQSAAITLSEGGRIAPDGLMEALIRGGYERVPMVEGRGQCAMRGAIVDDMGIKPRLAFGPLRAAISGRRISPPLFESMELLGRSSSLVRLRALRERLAAEA